MTKKDTSGRFSDYWMHYSHIGNYTPDWSVCDSEPHRHACRAPWLPKSKEAMILDIGCGWGILLRSLYCAGYRNLEGVEIDDGQARICRQAAGGRCVVHSGDARRILAENTGAYDLITVFDVAEHYDPEEFKEMLKLAGSALKPSGCVVIRTQNMANIGGLLVRYSDITHTTGYTQFSIVQLFQGAGFRDIEFVSEPTGWAPGVWRPWAPFRGLGLRRLIRKLFYSLVYWCSGGSLTPTMTGPCLEVYASKDKSKETI